MSTNKDDDQHQQAHTITRRSVIRTTGLAAIAAGLLGTTTAEASAPPPT